MIEWKIKASIVNKLWDIVFPKIMSRYWSNVVTNTQDPITYFECAYGKSFVDFINSVRRFYLDVNIPIPELMASNTFYIEIDFVQDRIILSRDKNTEALSFITQLVNELERVLLKLEELPVNIQNLRESTGILVKDWEHFRDNSPAPLDPDLVLALNELFLGKVENGTTFRGLINIIEDYQVIKPDLIVDPAMGGILYEERIIPEDLDVMLRIDLCYDIILSDKGIYFPWPIKPHNVQSVYDTYVIREVGASAIKIPGINVDSVTPVRPVKRSGSGPDAGGAGPPRCLSNEDFISKLKIEIENSGAPELIWHITGSDFQRLQLALPRVIAASWGNEVLHQIFSLMAKDKILIVETELAQKYFDIMLKLDDIALEDPTNFVSIANDNYLVERNLHRMDEIISGLRNKRALIEEKKLLALQNVNTAYDVINGEFGTGGSNPCDGDASSDTLYLGLIYLVGMLRQRILEIDKEKFIYVTDTVLKALSQIERIRSQLPSSELGDNIEDNLLLARPLLVQIIEIVHNDQRVQVGGPLIIDYTTDPVTLSFSSDYIDIYTDDVNLAECVKRISKKTFLEYFSVQAEFVFPRTDLVLPPPINNPCAEPNLEPHYADGFILVKSSDTQNQVYVTNEGIEIPFPPRPDLRELYESWSTGDSNVTTFTLSSCC